MHELVMEIRHKFRKAVPAARSIEESVAVV
jgi:hypothetical protein